MTLPPSKHYSIEPLGPGVHAALARPHGDAICNSGLVDLGDHVVVFDTSLTPRTARDLRDAAVRAYGRPPGLVVNSHWHFDHTLGNPTFPSLPIFGTRRTREILLERHDELMAELAPERLNSDLRELEERHAAAPTEVARRDLEFWSHLTRTVLADRAELSLVPPDHTFETHLTLPSRRRAELLSFGRGHTDADALLHLPDERLIFAGDLVVVGLQPSMGSGDPHHWLVVLDEIERLRPERIVPGHGPVVTADGIAETRAYVSGVLQAAEAPAGLSLPRALQRWEGTFSLEQNLAFVRSTAVTSRA